jgi:lysylphosphatidylglycerol synthetase-like protein (DUF2156 family)
MEKAVKTSTFSPLAWRRIVWMSTFAAGWMNIISALYPAIPSRVILLREILPLQAIRGSQTATVVTGFCLILVADGLRKRRRRALHIAVGLLLASSVLNLTKGLDIEEAAVAIILAAILLYRHRAFDVPAPIPSPWLLVRHWLAFTALFYCYVFSGFFILRQQIWPQLPVGNVMIEPFRLMLGMSAYQYNGGQAQWFARSLVAVVAVAAFATCVRILTPLIPHRVQTEAEADRARDLIKRFGSDSLSYFALQDHRRTFFHSSGSALLTYRVWRNVALVGGDPIGPREFHAAIVSEFLSFTAASGMNACLLGVSARNVPLYHSIGLKTIKIGEEALLDLKLFDASALRRKVRRAARHIDELGISHTWHRRSDMGADLLTQLDEISREWLESNGREERGFSMTLGRMPSDRDVDCELVVAWRNGLALGYLCLVPIYQGSGWSLDRMRRRADTPNGLMESLVLYAARTYAERGFRTLSLNFATLSNVANDIDSRALESTRKFLFAQLSPYYQLKSLHQFNSKFHPRWESRYLAYRDVLTFPKLALAIVQSEDPFRLPRMPAFLSRLTLDPQAGIEVPRSGRDKADIAGV